MALLTLTASWVPVFFCLIIDGNRAEGAGVCAPDGLLPGVAAPGGASDCWSSSINPRSTHPCKMLCGDQVALEVAPFENSHSCSSLDNLQTRRGRIHERTIDQDGPSLPSAMCLPVQSNSHVNSKLAVPDPMVGICRKFVNAVRIGVSGWRSDEHLRGNGLNLPVDQRKINIGVVGKERIVSCMVVQPLLKDVVGPMEVNDLLVIPEALESALVFSARLRNRGVVG